LRGRHTLLVVRDFRNERLGGAYLNPLDEGTRADQRMRDAAAVGSRDISRRSRLIVGWAIALLVIGFFVATFAGWIKIVPNQ
jgi:hypothetical protein